MRGRIEKAAFRGTKETREREEIKAAGKRKVRGSANAAQKEGER